jgi:hypothetical protein
MMVPQACTMNQQVIVIMDFSSPVDMTCSAWTLGYTYRWVNVRTLRLRGNSRIVPHVKPIQAIDTRESLALVSRKPWFSGLSFMCRAQMSTDQPIGATLIITVGNNLGSAEITLYRPPLSCLPTESYMMRAIPVLQPSNFPESLSPPCL